MLAKQVEGCGEWMNRQSTEDLQGSENALCDYQSDG